MLKCSLCLKNAENVVKNRQISSKVVHKCTKVVHKSTNVITFFSGKDTFGISLEPIQDTALHEVLHTYACLKIAPPMFLSYLNADRRELKIGDKSVVVVDIIGIHETNSHAGIQAHLLAIQPRPLCLRHQAVVELPPAILLVMGGCA